MTAPEDGARDGAARELDDAIRAVVVRLARPHASGGDVIERAAILAEGGDAAAIVAWIIAHAGEAEATAPRASSRGLHGARLGGEPCGDARHPAPLCAARRRSDVTRF